MERVARAEFLAQMESIFLHSFAMSPDASDSLEELREHVAARAREALQVREEFLSREFNSPEMVREFEKFVLWDEAGRDVRDVAPKLFRYMFEDQHVRHVMSRSLAKEMQEEVAAILRFAEEQRDDVRRNRLPRRSEQAGVKSKRALQKRKCER